ncbi:MAG: hypothetical protein ACFFE8_11680, partial [Candidatus Heimdallarchaeota archaeon]
NIFSGLVLGTIFLLFFPALAPTHGATKMQMLTDRSFEIGSGNSFTYWTVGSGSANPIRSGFDSYEGSKSALSIADGYAKWMKQNFSDATHYYYLSFYARITGTYDNKEIHVYLYDDGIEEWSVTNVAPTDSDWTLFQYTVGSMEIDEIKFYFEGGSTSQGLAIDYASLHWWYEGEPSPPP